MAKNNAVACGRGALSVECDRHRSQEMRTTVLHQRLMGRRVEQGSDCPAPIRIGKAGNAIATIRYEERGHTHTIPCVGQRAITGDQLPDGLPVFQAAQSRFQIDLQPAGQGRTRERRANGATPVATGLIMRMVPTPRLSVGYSSTTERM